MQYQAETEKATMMGGSNIQPVRPMTLADEPQVKRSRRVLLIILGICLALCSLNLINTIFGSKGESSGDHRLQIIQIVQAAISVVFYGFGAFVAYKYYQTGLRVFAWIGVIALVVMAIGIVFFLVVIIIFLIAAAQVEGGFFLAIIVSMALIIFFILFIVRFILTIIVVNFAFKLARSVDISENLTIRQI